MPNGPTPEHIPEPVGDPRPSKPEPKPEPLPGKPGPDPSPIKDPQAIKTGIHTSTAKGPYVPFFG